MIITFFISKYFCEFKGFKFFENSKLILAMLLVSFISQAELVLTLGGDINFNKTSFKSHAQGFSPRNSWNAEDAIPWSYFTQKISPLLGGDLNFANIETVVTANNSISEMDKRFKFKTHPLAIEHLISIGFNFFSLANNHAYDFGSKGFLETLVNMESLSKKAPIYYHGVGTRDELLDPILFKIKGVKIAFAAISIVDPSYQAGKDKVGLLNIRSREDYYSLVKNFKALDADLKILSIHGGTEGEVRLDQGQKKYYEYAIDYGDIDLIIGHHPHAVRPVSLYKNKLIFYSLGNYLMLGSANITQKSGGADWGMFAKIVYSNAYEGAEKSLKLEAVSLQVLTQTHSQVDLLDESKAISRLKAFQLLSSSQLGVDILPWKIKNGIGVFCSDNITEVSAKKLCN